MLDETVPEQVTAFLQKNIRGIAFCEASKSKVGLARRQQAQSVTATIAGQRGFTRNDGICQSAGTQLRWGDSGSSSWVRTWRPIVAPRLTAWSCRFQWIDQDGPPDDENEKLFLPRSG